MASTPRRIAVAFCQSFNDLDVDANIALRTPDCSHVFAPASLDFPPSMNNDQWHEHASRLREFIEKFPVEPKEIFEHPNQVTVWATSNAIFRKEAKDNNPGLDWSYHGEYVFILVLNQAGDKIERIVEFLDSTKAVEVRKLMDRARRNVGARH